MSAIPHKEERFLFPVYPLVPFAAALCLERLRRMSRRWLSPSLASLAGALCVGVTAVTVLVSASRVVALHSNFAAPLQLYGELSKHMASLPAGTATTVCVGKEWYRFPASFFVPHEGVRIAFVRNKPPEFTKADVGGQLPQPFNRTLSTHGVPPHMNDLNREEPSRFVPPSACDFWVDLLLEDAGRRAFPVTSWERISSVPFLDRDASNMPGKAFWTGPLWQSSKVYAPYALLKRRK